MRQEKLSLLAGDAKGCTLRVWIRHEAHMTKHWKVMSWDENGLEVELLKWILEVDITFNALEECSIFFSCMSLVC